MRSSSVSICRALCVVVVGSVAASQTAEHCSGNDSRCPGASKAQCLTYTKQGVDCHWDPIQPERSGVCVGNDSRCAGAPRSKCERLAMHADCKWKRVCKPWCRGHAIEKKCSWKNCRGCTDCDSTFTAFSTSSTTWTSSTTTTITTTTTSSSTATSSTTTTTTTMTTSSSTTTTGTTITSTTTTTAMECFGSDSRCNKQTESQCLKLKAQGTQCWWEPELPESTGDCTGHDSRCRGSSRSRCERLSEFSDCVWQRKCKGWCETNTNEWANKCAWKSCQGCHPCDSRRLQDSSIDEKTLDLFVV